MYGTFSPYCSEAFTQIARLPLKYWLRSFLLTHHRPVPLSGSPSHTIGIENSKTICWVSWCDHHKNEKVTLYKNLKSHLRNRVDIAVYVYIIGMYGYEDTYTHTSTSLYASHYIYVLRTTILQDWKKHQKFVQ